MRPCVGHGRPWSAMDGHGRRSEAMRPSASRKASRRASRRAMRHAAQGGARRRGHARAAERLSSVSPSDRAASPPRDGLAPCDGGLAPYKPRNRVAAGGWPRPLGWRMAARRGRGHPPAATRFRSVGPHGFVANHPKAFAAGIQPTSGKRKSRRISREPSGWLPAVKELVLRPANLKGRRISREPSDGDRNAELPFGLHQRCARAAGYLGSRPRHG
jgi:hypothetical protein